MGRFQGGVGRNELPPGEYSATIIGAGPSETTAWNCRGPQFFVADIERIPVNQPDSNISDWSCTARVSTPGVLTGGFTYFFDQTERLDVELFDAEGCTRPEL